MKNKTKTMRLSIGAWILTINSVVANAVVLTNAPEHTLKKCIQDAMGNIKCEEFQQDETEMVSYWPPGPYVLPMTRYGCPESSMHGWREGFISLALNEPYQIQIVSNLSTIDLLDNNFTVHWLPKNHQLFLPTTPHSITLYFCYKDRSNTTVDKGIWPDGNYSIYKTEEDCPPDFENHSTMITLPDLSWWVSDGYLPDFDITTNDSKGILKMQLCSRWKSSNKTFSDDGKFSDQINPITDNGSLAPFRHWTHYFLIKNKNTSCPIFTRTVMFEETVYIAIGHSKRMSSAMIKVMDTLCFYEQTADEDWLYERRRKNAYSVTIKSFTEGAAEGPPDYEKYPNFAEFERNFILGMYIYLHHWKIADLGRTIPVSAVELTVVEFDYYQAMHPRHQPLGPCINHDINCFISSGKWNFLQSEAMSCWYTEYCRVMGTSLSLAFKRIMEGRYVTLMHQEVAIPWFDIGPHFVYTFKVFTEVITYDPNANCNADLGMQNLDITDHQISASSTLPDFRPHQSRPYESGWCPQLDDPQPYIKVIFPVAQTIEGLTVHITPKAIVIQDREIFALFGSTFITFSYSEEVNDTTKSKILRIDSSKLTTETHTFWFMKAVRAQMVMLSLEKEPTFDLTCLRFEILGCKQNASYDMFYIRERQVPPFESVGFVSEIYTYNTLVTSVLVPDSYRDSQLYKWVIQFPEFHFIKLVFTLLQFAKSEMPPDGLKTCSDSIIISRDLLDISPSTTRVIDNTFYYRRSLSIETRETLIVLSFLTCPLTRTYLRGDGFKAIAAYEDIPTCFSINGRVDWKVGSYDVCRHTSMFITSLSYLGFEFLNTTEQWNIIIPTKRISLRFVEFHVPCEIEDKVLFVIKDKGNERFFCNINKPAEIFNSSSDEITVIFDRGLIKETFYTEPAILVGVKIFYTSIEGPGKHPVDYRDNKYSKEVTQALHRVAGNSYHTYGMFAYPETFVEGKTFHEASDLSLRDCFTTSDKRGASWWLLDLKNPFILDYIVLFGAITAKSNAIRGNCKITLSTGVTIYDLQPTGYICSAFSGERVINQTGIQTRYVRLHLHQDCRTGVNAVNALCEVQIYGKLASVPSERATRVPSPTTFVVHGEWGEWSPWSDDCFCDKKQYRYRLCNDPEPDIGGLFCAGDHVSHRPCHIESTSCKVYKDNYTLAENYNHCIGNWKDSENVYRWKSWSEWSECSSKCGFGFKSRQRECISTQIEGIKETCVGESSEEKACYGNDTSICMVCSDKFSKCYSIIAKHTNWKQAQVACFTRNMTLVSIMSLSEQHFVKYLLRQRRKSDKLPNNYFDADFYVHIGLQIRLDLKYTTPIWENGRYALYFTAWTNNNTFSKRCTRMSFKYYEDDKTWESEDCEAQLSEYTMCEYRWRNESSPVVKGLQIWTDDEKQMTPEQIPLSEYKGQLNITVSGKYCNESYCQDYKNLGYLHCRNTAGVSEECSVKLPPVGNSTLVYSKYLGKLNKTYSGKTCQHWASTIPHYHELHGNLFEGESILDAANYCRDLGNTNFLWCFTQDPDTRWEPCLLKELKTERRCVEKHEYTGQQNTTVTGKACIRWDKHTEIIRDSKWSAVNLTKSENYCRDHFNFGFIWCYIDSPNQSEEWEPCNPEEFETRQDEERSNSVIPSRDTFTCSDGKKIQSDLRCNGIFECDDKSDETDCLDMFTVHAMMQEERGNGSIKRLNFEEGPFFMCETGEWISVIAKCDTVIDCLDASDETGCNPGTVGFHGCAREQFQCDDGDCVHISQVCNFVEDCIDGSDEYCELEACSPLTEYNCRNGQCIPLSQRCDAVKQCSDGSDENECETCQSGVFQCDISLCIPMRLRCDNFSHCQDGTDEVNCGSASFTSCQDIWTAGFRKTGVYNIGPVQAYCSFENVFEDGEITTVLHFDIRFVSISNIFFNSHYGHFYNLPSTGRESNANFLIFNHINTNCTQQVMIRCVPSFEVFNQYENEYECHCGLVNYDIIGPTSSTKKYRQWIAQIDFGQTKNRKSPINIETCPVITYKNLTLSSAKPYLNNTDIEYESDYSWRSITFHGEPKVEKLIKAGPAICKHGFMPTDDDFPCNIHGKHIPSFERCIYDTDASGFPTGCSDGSHLIDCELYNCPENMLKCPGSYCIPQIFVCDGIHQCPGGEDEDECGCKQTNTEVLIMYDAVSTEGPQFARFARQFYSQTNIVRLLGYKAVRPLRTFNIKDILLEVHDIELSSSPNIEEAFGCNYKVFARELLNSIHFTNDGIKGVILIQNSEISKEVFQDITESRTYLTRNIRVYRVSQYLDTVLAPENEMTASNFTDIRVRRWKTLDGIGAEYFSEICKLSSKLHCPNGYKCSSSKSCIPMEQVCDGRKQCLHGDDELLCDFKCPVRCKCAGFFANCSATNFNPNMLYTIPKNTRHLDLSFNDKVSSVLQDTMLNLTKLSILNVSDCSIKILSQNAFLRLRNLRTLDLSFNKMSILPNFVFVSLIHLKNLDLRGNSDLSVIEQYALNGLSLIRDLQLANAKIFRVLSGTFEGLKLKTLDLSNNEIREIDNYAFQNSFIESIDFAGNSINHFNKETFTGLIGLNILKTPAFKFCCIRPNYVLEQNCFPQKDEFSSCDDLMRHSGLQFMIWLIGIMAFIGNILALFYRIKYDRERLKLGYGIFVTNLAVADFLMAIYLLIIAIADSAFRKKYIYVDDYWRHSIWCNIAGILSATSSEASVLFLCFITLDRLLVIKYPFGGVRITAKVATVCVVCAWVFSVFVALLPIAYVEYFNNEFYSKSGVCIALPLTRDRPPGWAYSLALFVCLNFVTFLLVALGQLSIFVEMKKSTGIATSAATSRKRDLKVARNLLLVVATDFLCWFPIGVMGMLALSDHPVSGEVYAWAAVFILPVNSALNPLLYTLSAIIGAKSFNPRVEEQSFKNITKDIGENASKCLATGRLISKMPYPPFQKISTLNSEDLDISWKAIIKIAFKVACILDTLHGNSLGTQPLDENSVFVEVLKKKLIGNVRIQSDPFVSDTAEDKEKNIQQFGMILRRLIATKVRNK